MEENREYDIVVLGASGVTGQYVVEELALHTENIRWCVAGRNPEKLKSVLKDISKLIDKSLEDIAILEVDVNDDDSIARMCKLTKLVINCVGPYRFYGENVVNQCVKNGTHHVDVSGEPQFLETIQLKYFHEAKEKKIYIVGSCGFDSIPCDVGVEFLRQKFDGDLDSVETYMSVKRAEGATVNFGTWQSAIYGLAHANELKFLRQELKKKVFTKEMPKSNYPLRKKPQLFNSDEVKGWCLPFIGSDRSVVLRSQMYNYNFKNQKPVQIQTYMKVYSLFYALVTLLMGGIFMLMTKFVYGRDLLEKYPELFSLGLFSKNTPSREKMLSGSFKLYFKGKGWSEKMIDPNDKHTEPPNKVVKAIMTGPDPAYITTAICLVNSALIVLRETDKLPNNGGVFTPGAAFSDTSLVELLSKRGIELKIIDN